MGNVKVKAILPVGKGGLCHPALATLRTLLVCAGVALGAGAAPAHAINGEQPGGQGYRGAAQCEFDMVIHCDDRFADVPSCHQRVGTIDLGMDKKVCQGGFLANTGVLETDVNVNSTASGSIYVAQQPSESETGAPIDVSFFCESYVSGGDGAIQCVKIDHDGGSSLEGNCGAFHVTNLTSTSCAATTNELKKTYGSTASFGWKVSLHTGDAGTPNAKIAGLCPGRSWECVNTTPSGTFTKVMAPEGDVLIDTGSCPKGAFGAAWCR